MCRGLVPFWDLKTALRDAVSRKRRLLQEKALVGAFSVITNLRMELFEALVEDGA